MIKHNYDNNRLRVMEVAAQIAWFRNWTMEPDFVHDYAARLRAKGLKHEVDLVDSVSTDVKFVEFKNQCDWEGCRMWLNEYLKQFNK